jgi:crotonobetainyl-CoA:carnitine CoA-transferase CaiB-like acyl-CoA transferase
LGEHSSEILKEAGLDQKAIDDLLTQGIIKKAETT